VHNARPPAQIEPPPTSRSRNWTLALLFVAGALNIFDRQVVNILAQAIKTDLSISDARLGLLTGTAFGLFYSILGIPLGRLADRVDRVKLIAAAMAVWSIFTALSGVAGNFSQLFVTRLGVGIGEAGSQPASTALVADLFPENRRASALSLLLVSTPVGSFLGLLLGGYVGTRWGWRAALLVAGIPGIIFAIAMILTSRDPKFSSAIGLVRQGPSLRKTLWMFIRIPRFRWLVAGAVCWSFLIYASGAWLPAFFIRVYGMSSAQIGRFAAIAVGLGGALGTIGGGFVCDLLRQRYRDVELKILMIALCLAVSLLLATLLSASRSTALISMILFDVFAFSYLTPTVSLIQQAVTEESRALAIAVGLSVSTILNLGFALPLVGLLSDALTPTQGRGAIRYALAVSALAAGLAGMLCHWCARQAGAPRNVAST
jgi:MFS transporter, Spinster family, sphingosine-1-phosphate transporter